MLLRLGRRVHEGAQGAGRLNAQLGLHALRISPVHRPGLRAVALRQVRGQQGGDGGFVERIHIQHALRDAATRGGRRADAQAGRRHRVPGLVGAFALSREPVAQGGIGTLHQALQQRATAQRQRAVQPAGVDAGAPVAALGALQQLARPGLAGQGPHGAFEGQQVGVDRPTQGVIVGLQRLGARHGVGLVQHLAQVAACSRLVMPGPQQRGHAFAVHPLAFVQGKQRQQLEAAFGAQRQHGALAVQFGPSPQQHSGLWRGGRGEGHARSYRPLARC